jgi:hypothetical protein
MKRTELVKTAADVLAEDLHKSAALPRIRRLMTALARLGRSKRILAGGLPPVRKVPGTWDGLSYWDAF